MEEQTQVVAAGRTYEMRGGEWREVEPQSASPGRAGSLLRTLGALAATVCAVLAIALVGVLATAAALVLAPVALLAAWVLGALPVEGLEKRKAP
jgi:Flp pilus assembly protein TadB